MTSWTQQTRTGTQSCSTPLPALVGTRFLDDLRQLPGAACTTRRRPEIRESPAGSRRVPDVDRIAERLHEVNNRLHLGMVGLVRVERGSFRCELRAAAEPASRSEQRRADRLGPAHSRVLERVERCCCVGIESDGDALHAPEYGGRSFEPPPASRPQTDQVFATKPAPAGAVISTNQEPSGCSPDQLLVVELLAIQIGTREASSSRATDRRTGTTSAAFSNSPGLLPLASWVNPSTSEALLRQAEPGKRSEPWTCPLRAT